MVNNEDGEETTSRRNEREVSKTADSEEGEEGVPRGHEWEVVSLTASAYAAAPGPRGDESIHEEKDPTLGEDYEAETSRALFMSGHFVFPPSQHENLPIESENLKNKEDDAGNLNIVKDSKAEQKEEENWNIERLNAPEEFLGIPYLEDKSSRLLSVHGPGLDESTALHRLAVDDKEQNLYEAATFSSFHGESEIGGSAGYGESLVLNEFDEPADHGLDSSSFTSRPPKSGEEESGDIDDSGLPCGAWWKRSVASLCAQVKDTNTFWSVFVAAAVMGLVILGQRWQQERWEVLQQRWQLSVGNEKSGRILSRLKDVIVGEVVVVHISLLPQLNIETDDGQN